LISQESIAQIQSRIDIIDIIGNFVKLKKRGANYLGNCPFHHEKTPSFTVSPTKEIYKCFGCGKSGNTIGFVMDHEKYSYVEALRWLAAKYNIELEETATSPEFKAKQLESESLFIVNQFAGKFFSEKLFQTEEGEDIALSYLKQRGFREDIIRKFELGYNPSAPDELAKTADKLQYSKEILLKSGLLVERNNGLSDNYRGRIIFPIHNQSGKILGFGARIIKSNDRAPKYINTPENEIYNKSKILYGAFFARTAIDKADECLLVEGYTDVVSLHQAGIENVVASGGTSLTTDQVRLIKKYTNNLTIIYDGDNAGIKAALRGLELALDEGLNVKLLLIPDKEDPDSYVNKIGASAFLEFIAKEKKDFILFQLELTLKEIGNDSAKKAGLVNQMAATLSRINKAEDFTKRQDYIKKVAELLKIDEAGFNALVNKIVGEKIQKDDFRSNRQSSMDGEVVGEQEESFEQEMLLHKDEPQEQAMARSLIEFGHLEWEDGQKVADYIFKQIDEGELLDLIDNPIIVKLINLYRNLYEEGNEPDAKTFLYMEDGELSQLMLKIMNDDLEISPNWKKYYEGHIPTREELFKQEVDSTLLYLQLRKIKRLIAENQKDMENTSDLQEQMLLIQTHHHLKTVEMELTKKLGTVILK
jgi:DNA primase